MNKHSDLPVQISSIPDLPEKKVPELLQWHPAFFAGIQIELKKYASNLIFEQEHQLRTKPMRIDVLIKKKLYMSFSLSFQIFSIVRIAPFYQLFGHFVLVVNLAYQGLNSYIFPINRG